MLVETFPVGALGCNCTVLACEATREAVVIDPGDDADTILDLVRANDLTVVSLIHTHAHIDHVGATGAVRRGAGDQAAIGLHVGDRWLYDNVPLQARMLGLLGLSGAADPPPAVDRWLVDGDVVTWGREGRAEVLHTPGHTPGSLCFAVESLGTVYTGDTLFAGSIGRTDLWGGSLPTLLRSIHKRLAPLDPDTAVIPGHGPATTVGDERRSNPFLTGR